MRNTNAIMFRPKTDFFFPFQINQLPFKGSVCIYGGCLVSTLVCAVADTAIASTIGLTSQTWYMEALADDDFRRKARGGFSSY